MTTEKRERIYKRLGLEFGSLSSEGGNDWNIVLAEIDKEDNRKLYNKSLKTVSININNEKHNSIASLINSRNNEYELGQKFKNKDGNISAIESICGVKRLVIRTGDKIEKTITISKIDKKEWEIIDEM